MNCVGRNDRGHFWADCKPRALLPAAQRDCAVSDHVAEQALIS